MEERKIALITGASKGIGAAVARELAGDGFDLWLNYRSDHEGAARVREDAERIGRTCRILPFYVCDGDAVRAALERFEGEILTAHLNREKAKVL